MSVFSHLDIGQQPEEGTVVVHGEETPRRSLEHHRNQTGCDPLPKAVATDTYLWSQVRDREHLTAVPQASLVAVTPARVLRGLDFRW